MPSSIRSKQSSIRYLMLFSKRKTLLKPAARQWLKQTQSESDFQAVMLREDNPVYHQGMMLLINREQLLSPEETQRVFVSKAYPGKQRSGKSDNAPNK